MTEGVNSMEKEKNIIYACFSHVPIKIEYPEFVEPIYMGEASNLGELNLKNLAPAWCEHHPILGATAGTFALKNYIVNIRTDQEYVGLCQYRKFISHKKIGITAENYQVMDIASSNSINKHLLAEVMLPETLKIQVSNPGQFLLNEINHNYLYQYKDCHFIEDILRFTAELVDQNILDKEDAYLFLNEKIFIPGGLELGIYPIDFWMQHIIKLEKVVKTCIAIFPNNREGYQSRAWSFCMERIGSYLILKEIRKNPDWISDNCGYLNLINNDDSKSYTPGI